jgi:hypothetical protein
MDTVPVWSLVTAWPVGIDYESASIFGSILPCGKVAIRSGAAAGEAMGVSRTGFAEVPWPASSNPAGPHDDGAMSHELLAGVIIENTRETQGREEVRYEPL